MQQQSHTHLILPSVMRWQEEHTREAARSAVTTDASMDVAATTRMMTI